MPRSDGRVTNCQALGDHRLDSDVIGSRGGKFGSDNATRLDYVIVINSKKTGCCVRSITSNRLQWMKFKSDHNQVVVPSEIKLYSDKIKS